MDPSTGKNVINEPEGHYVPHKENFTEMSPRSPLMTHRSPYSIQSLESDSIDLPIDEFVDTSIEQLYDNVCEIKGSDHSPSWCRFLSYGEESRIDSGLRFLGGGDYVEVEIKKEVETGHNEGDNNFEEEKGSNEDLGDTNKIHKVHLSPTETKRDSHLQLDSKALRKTNLRS